MDWKSRHSIAYALTAMLVMVAGLAARANETEAVVVEEYDYGVVEQGTPVRHVFRLKNREDVVQKLGKPKYSCGGCVKISKIDNVIRPGQEGEVTVELDTKGKQGLVRQEVVVPVEGGRQRAFLLSMRGTVRGIWADPSELDFGTMKTAQDGLPTAEFFVISAGYTQVRITEIKSPDPAVEVTTMPAKADAAARRQGIVPVAHIKATWKDRSARSGSFFTTIEVKTDIPGSSPITVPIHGYCIGNVRISPLKVFFGAVPAQGTVTRSVDLQWRDKDAPKPEEIKLETDHACVRANIERAQGTEGRMLVLKATVQSVESGERHMMRGQIVGRKDDKEVFAIPYVAYLAGPSQTASPQNEQAHSTSKPTQN